MCVLIQTMIIFIYGIISDIHICMSNSMGVNLGLSILLPLSFVPLRIRLLTIWCSSNRFTSRGRHHHHLALEQATTNFLQAQQSAANEVMASWCTSFSESPNSCCTHVDSLDAWKIGLLSFFYQEAHQV